MKELNKVTKLFINVDMVNGFVKMGAMADSYIEHIIPEQIRLMEQIQKEGEIIAIVKDTHQENCKEFNRFPAHCVKGTKESELVEELKPFEKEALVYEKNSTSTIYAPHFLEDVEQMEKLKEVIIVGCCTDICILNLAIPLQNYFDQKDRDVRITIPKNAVETYNSPFHKRDEYNQMAFKLMRASRY